MPRTAGGFSGADVWRLETPRGGLCLRAWPPGMRDGSRLAWMHETLKSIYGRGFRLLPVPLETTQSTTWVDWQDRFWDLTPWLPGQVDNGANTTPHRLRSALTTLAQFHACAAQVVPPGVVQGPSPALASRALLLSEMHHGLLERLSYHARQEGGGIARALADQILGRYRLLAPSVTVRVQSVVNRSVPLQICHGDLWQDHVLFVGERVSGLIDFGNLRVDSRTSDIARLLGSLAGDEPTGWQIGLEAYEQIHSLQREERALLRLFDQTTVLLSGINWLKWILLDGRRFSPWSRVEERLHQIVARLNRWQGE